MALDNVDVSGPFKTEEFALHPNEGFDSPPSHFDANLSADDDRKPASLPDYINLKDDQFTPSPEMGQCHESPTTIGDQPHPTEPAPPLPNLNNHAETINSDVANSSSNSSSHGASTSSGSDFGWMRHYQSLVEYKQREGTCEVPQKYKHGSLNLGVWVNKVSAITLYELFMSPRRCCADLDLTVQLPATNGEKETQQWQEIFYES